MNAETFEQTLEAFRQRTPFRPFTIALIDGDKFEVDHPSAYTFRRGVAVYVSPGGVPIIFDPEGVSQIIGDLKGEPTE